MLERRDRQPELMDDPGVDEAEHALALRGLQRVNWISDTAGRLWKEMERYAQSTGALRVLDLGSGGGDVLCHLARRAAKRGVAFDGIGWDLSDTAGRYAERLARSLVAQNANCTLRFLQRDCLRDALPEGVDIVTCTLFLHHLERDDAVHLLARMKQAARYAVIVDDLVRSPLGYSLAWMGTRLLTRSRIVHTDGPLSVRAAFTVEELKTLAKEAGLEGVRATTHWPYRCMLHWRRA